MQGLGWEVGIGLIGCWLFASPCLLGLVTSEELWNLGFAANLLLAGLAMGALAIRALAAAEA